MNKFYIFLAVLGLLFFAQTGLIMHQFYVQNCSNVDANNVKEVIDAMRTAELVRNTAGSLFGCLGSWLLVLYLKIRKLEKASP